MEPEINGVSEAFSIQPNSWHVGIAYGNHSPLKEIKRESIYDTGDPYDFYVGYDQDGNKVFAIRVSAANVFYN